MNITPHVNPNPVATVVNPPTDSLRQENITRPVITAPSQTNGSPAEKSATDKNKGSGQDSEQFNFVELEKSAEKNASQITDNSGQANQEGNKEGKDQEQNTEQNPEDSKESVEAAQHEEEISQLKVIDTEVRAHEIAHSTVGGALAASPSYEFEIGPDGKQYAVAGEVSIDVSPVANDPQATIEKMEKVQAAALAPAEPSSQDFKVAAQASELIIQSQAELVAAAVNETENENELNKNTENVQSNEESKGDNSSVSQSEKFDLQMNQILEAQEKIAPSVSNDVKARSERIEGYYSNITQAYEKRPSFQFEITA